MFPDLDLLRALLLFLGKRGNTNIAAVRVAGFDDAEQATAVGTLVRGGVLRTYRDATSLEDGPGVQGDRMVELADPGTFFVHVYKDDATWQAAKDKHGAAGEPAFRAIVADAEQLYWQKKNAGQR